ncbi:FkbM family methyltransferase [Nitrobacteraceae bacterium AZCC 2161]
MGQFTSFAQNYEDVILWRALKHIKKGFYVDCGAYSPFCHSVTRAFYERGWRGINIEPVPHLLHDFEDQRPDDINLNIALADHSNGATFYEILDTGLSTFSRETARRHIEAGFVAKSLNVRTASLSEVLTQHGPDEIHFLKVDVEGAERLVLEGLDLKRFRPWIVVVEAVRPLTQEPNHREWESILLTQDYDFAYFDGLNRFYVAQEHLELSTALALPPNIFDNFVQIDRLTELKVAQQELAMLRASSSWKLTAPIRKTKLAFQALQDNFPHNVAFQFSRLFMKRKRSSLSFVSKLFRESRKGLVGPI